MSDTNIFPPVVAIEIDPQARSCSCGRGPVSHEFHDEPTCDLCRAEYEDEMAALLGHCGRCGIDGATDRLGGLYCDSCADVICDARDHGQEP
jgi:hypothetical protein